MAASTLDLIRRAETPKGDVLAVARVAAIQGAKRTSDLIPLCHPLPLSGMEVTITPSDSLPGLVVSCRCRTSGKTGVEMEAMTSVSIGLLTLSLWCNFILTRRLNQYTAGVMQVEMHQNGEYPHAIMLPLLLLTQSVWSMQRRGGARWVRTTWWTPSSPKSTTTRRSRRDLMRGAPLVPLAGRAARFALLTDAAGSPRWLSAALAEFPPSPSGSTGGPIFRGHVPDACPGVADGCSGQAGA